MHHTVKFAAALAMAGMALSPPALRAQAAKPALYNGEQAQAGATVYGQACAACHGAALEGVSAPALKGPSFGEMAAAQSLTADTLLNVIASTMPQSDPGSLKPEEYNAVTAYILQQNGYPAGKVALSKDAAGLKDTKITP